MYFVGFLRLRSVRALALHALEAFYDCARDYFSHVWFSRGLRSSCGSCISSCGAFLAILDAIRKESQKTLHPVVYRSLTDQLASGNIAFCRFPGFSFTFLACCSPLASAREDLMEPRLRVGCSRNLIKAKG